MTFYWLILETNYENTSQRFNYEACFSCYLIFFLHVDRNEWKNKSLSNTCSAADVLSTTARVSTICVCRRTLTDTYYCARRCDSAGVQYVSGTTIRCWKTHTRAKISTRKSDKVGTPPPWGRPEGSRPQTPYTPMTFRFPTLVMFSQKSSKYRSHWHLSVFILRYQV